MKTALKTGSTAIFTLIRRQALCLKMREHETLIDGQSKALEDITCPATLQRIELARSRARRQLALIRAEYNATFPPGVRFVWTMA